MLTCLQEDVKGSKVVSATQELHVSRDVELVKEMLGKGILPNMLTYKPIMSCLAKKVKVDQFHELAKWIEEAVVPSDGVFIYYEIQLYSVVSWFWKSNSSLSRLHQKRPSSLDGEYFWWLSWRRCFRTCCFCILRVYIILEATTPFG